MALWQLGQTVLYTDHANVTRHMVVWSLRLDGTCQVGASASVAFDTTPPPPTSLPYLGDMLLRGVGSELL